MNHRICDFQMGHTIVPILTFNEKFPTDCSMPIKVQCNLSNMCTQEKKKTPNKKTRTTTTTTNKPNNNKNQKNQPGNCKKWNKRINYTESY